MVKVRWSRMAQDRKNELIAYGLKTFGKKSTIKFNDSIKDFTKSLSGNPLMGKVEPLLEDSPRTYRSITIHKHYKLIYYIEDTTVYIADLWDTRQEPRQLTNRIGE